MSDTLFDPDLDSIETIPLDRRSGHADRRSEIRCPIGRRSTDSFADSDFWQRIFDNERGDGRRG